MDEPDRVMVEMSMNGDVGAGQERLRADHERPAGVVGINFEDELTA